MAAVLEKPGNVLAPPLEQPKVKVNVPLEPSKGLAVLWWRTKPSQGEEGTMALIGKVNSTGTCCLSIMSPNPHLALRVEDGVQWLGDPKLNDRQVNLAGVWDYTPLHKRMVELLNTLKA